MTKTTVDALHSLKPNAEWTLMVDGSLVWHDKKQTKPTDKELADEVIRLQAEYDAQAYSRARAKEYPSLESVTVALAEKAEGNPAMWDEITKQRQAIKNKYPKN